MKALPPPASQLELLNRQEPLVVVTPEIRGEVVGALAEILRAAFEAIRTRAEAQDETP
jgi:hypothetical protein